MDRQDRISGSQMTLQAQLEDLKSTIQDYFRAVDRNDQIKQFAVRPKIEAKIDRLAKSIDDM